MWTSVSPCVQVQAMKHHLANKKRDDEEEED
jgi:hypothetical protein